MTPVATAPDTLPEPLRAAFAGIAAERDEAVVARKSLEIEVKLLKEMIVSARRPATSAI